MSIWNRLSVQFVLLVLCASTIVTVVGSLILDSSKRAAQLESIEEEVSQLLEMVSIPAAIAAYKLDAKMGQEIVAPSSCSPFLRLLTISGTMLPSG
jgi:hypothetical protein